MSGLLFNTGLCQGWSSPNTNYSVPTITSLSGTYSPAGGTTLVGIFGTNFKLFSTVKFGTYTPTMIFISSMQIEFYVPTSAPSGTTLVQVFNDNYASNIVEYTLDDTSISVNTIILTYSVLPTFTPNMIGYSNTIFDNVGATGLTSMAQTSLITDGVIFPIGVYLCVLHIQCTTNNVSGKVSFFNCGLSTSETIFLEGIYGGSTGSYSIPDTLSYAISSFTKVLQVSTSVPYYLFVYGSWSGVGITTDPGTSYLQYTRIA